MKQLKKTELIKKIIFNVIVFMINDEETEYGFEKLRFLFNEYDHAVRCDEGGESNE